MAATRRSPRGSLVLLCLVIDEQTIVPTTARKGQGSREHRSLCVALPDKHFSSAAVLEEAEGNLDGVAAEEDANFRL